MVSKAKRSAGHDSGPEMPTEALKDELLRLAQALPDALPDDVAAEIWQGIQRLERLVVHHTARPVLALPEAAEPDHRPRRSRSPKRGPNELTPEEWRQLLEERARRYMGMSADEFVRAWNAGEIKNPDRPEVMSVLMLIPFE